MDKLLIFFRILRGLQGHVDPFLVDLGLDEIDDRLLGFIPEHLQFVLRGRVRDHPLVLQDFNPVENMADVPRPRGSGHEVAAVADDAADIGGKGSVELIVDEDR